MELMKSFQLTYSSQYIHETGNDMVTELKEEQQHTQLIRIGTYLS